MGLLAAVFLPRRWRSGLRAFRCTAARSRANHFDLKLSEIEIKDEGRRMKDEVKSRPHNAPCRRCFPSAFCLLPSALL